MMTAALPSIADNERYVNHILQHPRTRSPGVVELSRLTEVGPRLIEVGPIHSSVSLKLAHRGVAALALSH
jgi:hypothetical protein